MRSVAILIPVIVGIVAVTCTIAIHALAVGSTVRLVLHERRLGRVVTGYWTSLTIIVPVVLFALTAHLIEMALWAVVFLFCGEFPHLGAAFYHSAVSYTSLGGDVVMSPAWRLLEPLETADGMLMFGLSTAMVFAVIQGLIQSRFPDLRA